MRIGVLSDTHGQVLTTLQALQIFEHFEVGLVIHCGDIGPGIVGLFSRWPTHFVAGNIDSIDLVRNEVFAAGQSYYEPLGSLEVEGRSVAFLHGDDAALLKEAIRGAQWDVVCYGHTHVARASFEGRTLVVNPGAIDRTPNPSVALIGLPSLVVAHIAVRFSQPAS